MSGPLDLLGLLDLLARARRGSQGLKGQREKLGPRARTEWMARTVLMGIG